MPKRLGIFSIYDPEGIVDEATFDTLTDLRTCVDYLIVAVNGTVQDPYHDKLCQIAEKVVVRSNQGFDAGAYKDVLFHHLSSKELQNYDEFILCNDTFYGPFVPFREIFSEMEQRGCDFWGLSYSDSPMMQFLHSYFLCYRAEVFFSCIMPIFAEHIPVESSDINCIYGYFERAFFQFPTKKGYHFSCYSSISNHNLVLYQCGNIFMREYNLPVLKKKCFAPELYVEDNVYDALQYISRFYHHDIANIIASAKRRYGFSATVQQVLQAPPRPARYFYRENGIRATDAELNDFISRFSSLYIYGAGYWGQILYAVFVQPTGKMQGFICSDKAHVPPEGQILGVPVYPLCDIQPDDSTGIIVALGAKNTQQVRPLLNRYPHVFYLY